MAYVGTPLDTTNAFQSLAGKRFNGDASTTAFTLDSAPNSTLDIEVFIISKAIWQKALFECLTKVVDSFMN